MSNEAKSVEEITVGLLDGVDQDPKWCENLYKSIVGLPLHQAVAVAYMLREYLQPTLALEFEDHLATMAQETYYVYPFMDDESATIWHADAPDQTEYIIPGTVDQEEVTHEQMVKIALESSSTTYPGQKVWTKKELEAMSIQELADHIDDFCTLFFDSMAIIPMSRLPELCRASKRATQRMDGDSSTYAAVESFNELVKSLAVKVIEFPQSSEREDEDG
jgi:hypothetical protein